MRIKKLDTTTEKRILWGSVFSKEYLQEMGQLYDASYFENSYVKFLIEKCLDYYDQYNDAPGYSEIKNEVDRQDFINEDREVYEKLILDVSQTFEKGSRINSERILDQTIEYFKKRELEITNGNVSVLLNKGDVKGAELELLGFRDISRLKSSWQNPFSPENVERVLDNRDFNTFFKFPGDFGRFIGEMKKGWLIGVSGPFKRGKTWMQLEFGVMAIMQKLPVAFISLEMSEEQMFERIYKRIYPYLKEGTISLYPCFDCALNQTGLCRKRERVNKVVLFNKPGIDSPPDFYETRKRGYKPCDRCRIEDPKSYEKATWFEEIKIPEFNPIDIRNAVEVFNKYYGKLFRLKAYPRFSASIQDMERDLDLLELTENFIPQMVIIDHADIVKPDTNVHGVEKEDLIWMNLARIAGERKILAVSGTQLNKESLDAVDITQKHTAKWIGKLGHVDVMMTLNQTEEEKGMGVLRVGVMAHRHEDFYESDKVTILQNVKLGQIHLDSQI